MIISQLLDNDYVFVKFKIGQRVIKHTRAHDEGKDKFDFFLHLFDSEGIADR